MVGSAARTGPQRAIDEPLKIIGGQAGSMKADPAYGLRLAGFRHRCKDHRGRSANILTREEVDFAYITNVCKTIDQSGQFFLKKRSRAAG